MTSILTYLCYGSLAAAIINYWFIIGYGLVAIIRDFSQPSAKKGQLDPKKPADQGPSAGPQSEAAAPRLRPLNCQQCGGGLPLLLDQPHLVCPSCGTQNQVPDDHQRIFPARHEQLRRLQTAERYWWRTRFLTSGWVRWGCWLAALWLLAQIGLVQYLAEQPPVLDFGLELPENHTGVDLLLATSGLGYLVTVFVLFFIPVGLQPRLRKVALPAANHRPPPETSNCPQCGGGIGYSAGAWATVCGYCGIETVRAKLAQETRQQAQQARQSAQLSAVEAMQQYRDTVQGARSTIVVLTFLFTIGLLGVGFLNWLND
jgi:uncharacterized Zn finger protein (UPF0148 family)